MLSFPDVVRLSNLKPRPNQCQRENRKAARCAAFAKGFVACSLLLTAATASSAQTAGRSQTPRAVQLSPQQPRAQIYQWRNVEINGGGFVSGIIFHPRARDVVYARTDIGGVYRWDVKSRRWIALTDEFGADDWNMLGIESVALDPSDANRVYVAAGTYTNDWAGNGAILRSTNRGRTWLRTNLPFKNGGNEHGRSMGERLTVDPNRGNILFFASRHNGLWKSVDFGATWQQVKSFPITARTNGVGCAWFLFDGRSAKRGQPTQTLYAGLSSTRSAIWRSVDGGATWKSLPGAPSDTFPHHGVLDARGVLYTTYGNGPGPNGVTDGAVWKFDTKSERWTDITPVKRGKGDTFGYAGLAVDARHRGTLMVATMDRWTKGDDIFRSTDDGATWKSVKSRSRRNADAAPYLKWGRPEADLGHWIGDLEIDPFNSGRALYVTGATIWGSDDVTKLDSGQMTNWTVRAAGIEEVSVSDVISLPQGPHLISGMRDIGGFRHDDLTISPRAGMMTNPRLSRNESLDFAALNTSLVVRVGDGAGAYSTDSGATWTPFASKPLIDTGQVDMGQGPISVSADGAAWIWATEIGAAFVTKDRGATWTEIFPLPLRTNIVADRATPATFYALASSTRTLLVSTDGGTTFATRATDLPDGFNALEADSRRAGYLWLLGSGGLMRSRDGGATWLKVAPVAASEALGFGRAAPGRTNDALYLSGTVGRVRGVFRSDDDGATWLRINDDRHQYGWIGKAITGDPRVYGRVYFATNGRGVIYGEPMKNASRGK